MPPVCVVAVPRCDATVLADEAAFLLVAQERPDRSRQRVERRSERWWERELCRVQERTAAIFLHGGLPCLRRDGVLVAEVRAQALKSVAVLLADEHLIIGVIV